MSKNHQVIVVPGLGGSSYIFRTTVHSWMKFGIIPEVFDMNWRDEQTDFNTQIDRLTQRIDQLHRTGARISLIGTSAGGSAVLNAYCAQTEKIHRVVNICGRMIAGQKVFPSLETASRTSTIFHRSVLTCERNVSKLSTKDRSRILTIQPIFDEIVPISTMTIPGSRFMKIWSFEHLLSISLAMTIHAHRVVGFLKFESLI